MPIFLVALLLPYSAGAPASDAIIDDLYPEDRIGQECWTAGGCKDDGATTCDWCGAQQYCCRSDWRYSRGDNCYSADFDEAMNGHHHCVALAPASNTPTDSADPWSWISSAVALKRGVLIGFGDGAEIEIEECLFEGPEEIVDQFKQAIDHFAEGTIGSVIAGLREI